MNELVDRFWLASNLVDNFFMDLINGTNQESVDEAFKGLGLSRTSVENKLIQVNEKVNPFESDKMGHNASKKIIYKSILTMMWEEKMKG
jgi:hypothetical protein